MEFVHIERNYLKVSGVAGMPEPVSRTYEIPKYPEYVLVVEDEVPQLIRCSTGHQVQQFIRDTSHGYVLVHMIVEGVKKIRHFGNIVLRAVVGEPEAGESCDHIDQNRSNNVLSNLRWATAAEQRKNQGAMSERARPVTGTDNDLMPRTFVDAFSAASEFISVADADRTIISVRDEIHAAAQAEAAAFSHKWSFTDDLGKDVVEWRPIPTEFCGHSSGHLVSASGLIKERHGRVTAGCVHGAYRVFNAYRVHRIVAAAWCPAERGDKPYVDHMDRNKMNNRAENLRWVTAEENARNAEQPASVPVQMLAPDGSNLMNFPSMAEATRHVALSRVDEFTFYQNISNAVSGCTDTAYGFRWQAVDEQLRREAATKRSIRTQLPGKSKPVLRIHPRTGEIEPFRSGHEASKITPAAQQNKISQCCLGKRITAGSFCWRFADPRDDKGPAPARTAHELTHTALDGTVIKVYGSANQAAKGLLEKGFTLSCSTISRGIDKRKRVDLVLDGVHSQLRTATLEEVEALSKADLPDMIPYKALVPVVRVDPDTSNREPFASLAEAAQSVASLMHPKPNPNHIHACAKGDPKRKLAYKFKWELESNAV